MLSKHQTVLKEEYLNQIDDQAIAKLVLSTDRGYKTFERWVYKKKVDEFAHPTYLKVLAKHFGVKPTELTEEKELINS